MKKVIFIFLVMILGCQKAPYRLEHERRLIPNWFSGFSQRVFQFAQLGSLEGTLYLGSSKGRFYAVDGIRGKKLWQLKLDGSIDTTPQTFEDKVFVGTNNGKLYALSRKEGKMLWVFNVSGEILGEPLVSGEFIYFGTHLQQVYAVHLESGELAWKYKKQPPDKMVFHAFARPLIKDEKLAVGFYDGSVVCLNAKSGAKIWAQEFQDSEKFSDISWIQRYTDELFVAGKFNGQMILVNWLNGAVENTFESTASAAKPILIANELIAPGKNGDVSRINPQTGEIKWTYKPSKQYRWNGIAELGESLFVTSYDGTISVLSSADGTLKWIYELQTAILGAPVIIGKRAWFLTQRGQLISLK